MPRPVGRPSKLTPELQEEICGHVADGLTYADACRLANIVESTFHRWQAAGKQAKRGKYKDFHEALKAANTDFRATHIRRIRDASLNDTVLERTVVKTAMDGSEVRETTREMRSPPWAPSAWLLERKFPDEFGRRVQTVEHSGQVDTGPLKVEFINRIADLTEE